MTMVDSPDLAARDQPRAPMMLDPFSYFQDVASKIRGLGGPTLRPELEYGFHTCYDWCAPGRCTMTVHIEGLTASSGILALQVNMLSLAPGAQAKIATIERVSLAELAAAGGTALVAFESLRGQIYALYGMIAGDTDAAATRLTVELDRPGHEQEALDPGIDIMPSSFGTSAVDQVERLASDALALFAAPVSQPSSPAQTAELAYRRWAKALGEPVTPGRKQWERLYILQVLERYGMLQHGAHGLHIDGEAAGMVEQIALRGCAVTTIRLPDHPLGAGDASLDRSGEHVDFLWTRSLSDRFGSAQEATACAEALMAHLRPGGIGIHLFPFIRDSTPEQAWHDGPHALSRGVIERFALNLVSRGYEIAQLKFELGPRAIGKSRVGLELGSFGVIARRPMARS